MLEPLKPNTLADYVGSEFEVLENFPKPISLTLTSIVEHGRTARQEIFSLFFHGPEDVPLPQRTYRLQHAQAGTLDVFIVPVAKDKNGFQYESVFNNLI